MKVSKEIAASHRAALLAAASRLFRERGFDKVGIAEVAAAAGLTHGAFYTHFASKEELCDEAVAAALDQSAGTIDPGGDWRAYVESYLSLPHVRQRGKGCPLAALTGDIAREGAALKATFAAGLDRSIAKLTRAMDEKDAAMPRDRAILTIAAMVGALSLARSVGPELRDEILAATRTALTKR